MDMANVKLAQLAQHGDILDRYGASIRFLGRKDLLRPDVIAAVDRAVEVTSRNGDRVLNICCPYTSRDEIANAIKQTVVDYSTPLESTRLNETRKPFSESHIASNIRAQALQNSLQNAKDQEGSGDSDTVSAFSQDDENAHQTHNVYDSPSSVSSSTTLHLNGQASGNADFLSSESITPQTLSDRMYTKNDPPIDILIRTSGVERLSDFMLWQCHEDTELVFLDVLWPEFDLWQFLPVLWKWQRRVTKSWKGESGLDTEDWKSVTDANLSVRETAATRLKAY
jgi:ditrans,polycis-polyprenyl diphosphate synthase